LLADAINDELEAVAEPLGGIGGKGRGGELVLNIADSQLRLPGAAEPPLRRRPRPSPPPGRTYPPA